MSSPIGQLNEVVEYNPTAGRIDIPKYLKDKFRDLGFDLGWVRVNNLGRKKLEGWIQVTVAESDNVYNMGTTEFAQFEDLWLCKRKTQIGEQKKVYLEKINKRNESSIIEQNDFETTAQAGNAQTNRKVNVKRELHKSSK